MIVGADRIAANGDVANKIGTYPLAARGAAPRHPVLRRRAVEHPRPVHPERARDPHRAACRASWRTASAAPSRPSGVAVYNPAFDVTPAELVTAFVTDRGIIRPPYRFEHARHAESVQG